MSEDSQSSLCCTRRNELKSNKTIFLNKQYSFWRTFLIFKKINFYFLQKLAGFNNHKNNEKYVTQSSAF